MPRASVPFNPNAPYHVCARCINKEWFNLPIDVVWSVMEDQLFLANHSFQLRIHAFVLMSNHFHLIVTAPNENMSDMLRYFMREVSREISWLSGRINQTWGGRNHKTFIGAHHYFMNTYKYVYRNPVRANICGRVEAYPFSTLAGLCGLKRLIIPVCEDTVLFNPHFDQSALNWLNTKPLVEADEEMRRALRRAAFKLPSSKSARTKSQWETDLI